MPKGPSTRYCHECARLSLCERVRQVSREKNTSVHILRRKLCARKIGPETLGVWVIEVGATRRNAMTIIMHALVSRTWTSLSLVTAIACQRQARDSAQRKCDSENLPRRLQMPGKAKNSNQHQERDQSCDSLERAHLPDRSGQAAGNSRPRRRRCPDNVQDHRRMFVDGVRCVATALLCAPVDGGSHDSGIEGEDLAHDDCHCDRQA
mmetsp:Transcript_13677/g.36858  ORF Transcript_13677/g.36858 Transcript_13677/m.36858 type:complete len:207 (-) Transcript_13677:148-768(-)